MAWETWAPAWAAVIAGLVAFALAAFVRQAGHRTSMNRQLVWLLILEGLFVLGLFGRHLLFGAYPLPGYALMVKGQGSAPLTGPSILDGLWILGVASLHFLPWLYLTFLANLDTPFMRFLRRPAVSTILLLLGVGFVVGFVSGASRLNYEEMGYYVGPLDFLTPWVRTQVFALFFLLTYLLMLAVSVIGLVVSIKVYRRSPAASAARRRAKSFALAFGVRDGLYLLLLIFLPFAALGAGFAAIDPIGIGEGSSRVTSGPSLNGALFTMGFPLILLVYLPLLVYGILRNQLFDIDLRIKLAIRHSTVATAFVVAFFIGSEVLEQLIPVDGILLGVGTAGLVALGIHPIRRAAERVANVAMPKATGSPEYLAMRKMEVYRASLEAAYANPTVTPPERVQLEAARKNLGITRQTADWLEEQVRTYTIATNPKARLYYPPRPPAR